ncbi:hypothetical protein LZ554_003975 [Drepanopeziza brunnea f. sp. 'monogermtubi']|nr:hypothetical protein LZ554_003975 [Drepanopeziza brunnea f. sp. 'monogermtubi']
MMSSNQQEIGSAAAVWAPTETAPPKPAATSPTTSIHDLICIGFGPASLAIAIALSDSSSAANVCFLERQPKFAWHAGMQLPGAKMQISFMKDLATPRNPKSHFTFVNYLFSKNRLNTFINLDTFTPSRMEYEDYLRWCASHFEDRVTYGQEVVSVEPDVTLKNGKVSQFKVVSKDTVTGALRTRVARHVVIAVGGKGKIPAELPQSHRQVVHSSKYSQQVLSALPDPSQAYHIAVVGNGQSAAEIFNDLPSRYPNAKVSLLIKGSALRPSDDSPFVNEIFDPERVDGIFATDSALRATRITADKATNYGVVRLNLLEHLYEKLYLQRLRSEDPATWPLRIRSDRQVSQARETADGKLLLRLAKLGPDAMDASEEELLVDAVFVATGYERNAHESMLTHTRGLLRPQDREQGAFPVRRDYKIAFDESKVAADASVWLQGCNEKTHGLSDTLLSILAVRGGELVQSMFGGEQQQQQKQQAIRAKL